MNHGQVYSAATKTVKCFISTAEASQVIINKAFLGSFSGVGSKMVGKSQAASSINHEISHHYTLCIHISWIERLKELGFLKFIVKIKDFFFCNFMVLALLHACQDKAEREGRVND